jgi:hypothetical protein
VSLALGEFERLTSEPPLCDYEFGEVWFKREEAPFWVFAAASQELQDEGYIPGAVYVLVDKRNGHFWSGEEQEQYYISFAERVSQEQRFQHRESEIPLNIGDQLWIVVISLDKQSAQLSDGGNDCEFIRPHHRR